MVVSLGSPVLADRLKIPAKNQVLKAKLRRVPPPSDKTHRDKAMVWDDTNMLTNMQKECQCKRCRYLAAPENQPIEVDVPRTGVRSFVELQYCGHRRIRQSGFKFYL